MISALIFDCDGTLTNSMPVHYVCWRQTMARHGIEFGEERFYALGGVPSDKARVAPPSSAPPSTCNWS